jgi:uncharacterized protein with beta-barrel porin domain
MTNIWACPRGTTGRPAGARFRNAFLGTVAAGALSLAFAGPALAGSDACTIDGTGTIETCTGNQSAGIAIASPTPVTTLNVNNLTTAIAPASGTIGVGFSSAGDVTLTSNTGAFGITTAGDGAAGIYATSSLGGAVTVTSTGNITTAGNQAFGIAAGGGTVTVTSTGNITTAGNHASGIFASGVGVVTVTSTGNVAATGDGANGIYASALADAAVSVTSTGNITTAGMNSNSSGVLAVTSGFGAVTVTSTGNINVTGTTVFGINAGGGLGAVTVTSTGNITASGSQAFGIDANSIGDGAVTVTSSGNIAVTGDTVAGIAANNNGTGAVTVISTGNIVAEGNTSIGIAGKSVSGAVTVTSTGNITAGTGMYGIYARSLTGAATVTSIGNITAGIIGIVAATNGSGAATVTSIGNITASVIGLGAVANGSGAATVTSIGNITASAIGLEAAANGSGAVTVTSIGNIAVAGTSLGLGLGINATGTTGAVSVTSTGNITAAGNGGVGVFAASNSGPIAITIKSGTVSGGSGAGPGGPAAAVALTGGSNNTLTNMGTLSALSGLAIVGNTGFAGDIGNNTVNNFGTVIGNVILGSGTNAFNNQAGGFLNAGATVDLGAGNTLTNAGTLSPGGAGAIQTTALSGNLVQSATGRLLTDINIAGATSDRVNVSGTASLAGAVQLQVSNLTAGPWQQTVFSAAGGTTNNGLSLLASPALQAQLVFPNATDVVVKSAGINFVVPGLGVNQTALGNGLNGALQSGGAGGGPIFNALLNGPTSLAGYGLALTQLSGEAATGTQQVTFDAMNLFMGTMLDPFNRGTASAPGGGVSGYASEGDASADASGGRKRSGAERDAYAMFTKAPAQSFEARWSVWGAGFGGSQSTDGNATVGSASVTSRIAGGAVGADYLFSPDTIAGFALAGGGTSFNLANGLGNGRSDLFQAGAYVRHTMGAGYIAGALAYGWQDITTNRTVTLAGFDQLQARFNANAFSGRLEGGYRFVSPWMGVGITPYAAAQFTTFDLPAYAEQAIAGTNNFALAYGAKSVTDPRSELGFRTDKSYVMQDGVVTLRGRLAWAHDYDPDRAIGATFQTLPGASFVVNGAAQASDSVLTTASIERKWINNWSIAATFEGEFSNVTSSYAGKGVVRYTW